MTRFIETNSLKESTRRNESDFLSLVSKEGERVLRMDSKLQIMRNGLSGKAGGARILRCGQRDFLKGHISSGNSCCTK